MTLTHSPHWIKDLIIYEIATKGFTSPNGPESGTFRSMQAKLPHMAELGINGIWLTGHSLADPNHFYNIWTQYACIEPDKIDPTLGTEHDFKDFISSAHEHDILIFLEVIEHGVMEDSPLVHRHPNWFRGKSWGMVDYDFDLHNPELDQWWVDMWTRYVLDFGVDGFRIDLGMRRVDLYQQVRDNAAHAGKEIIFINELNYAGALDCSVQSGLERIPVRSEFLKIIDLVQRDEPTLLSPHSKRPQEINSQHGYANSWDIPEWNAWLQSVLNRDHNNETPPWAYSSGQISSHDNGWEGFKGDNPFVAQGSNFIFGYGALFSGLVPIFVAGEEFNAPYHSLPNLSPNLFGGAEPGKGRWLYGNQLDWSALELPMNKATFQDVKKLIAIRKQESSILRALSNHEPKHMAEVPFSGNLSCPIPYVRWQAGKAIIIAGNSDTRSSLHIQLHIPLDLIELSGYRHYVVTNLWDGRQTTYSESDFAALPLEVPPDKTPQGGLSILKVEPYV